MKAFNKPLHQKTDCQKTNRLKLDRLIAGLAQAHQSKGVSDAPPAEKWRQTVMRSIRQAGPLEEKANRDRFTYLTWRLAPVAAALLVLMSIWIKQVDNNLEFQLASLVVSDPAQTDVYNLF